MRMTMKIMLVRKISREIINHRRYLFVGDRVSFRASQP